MGKIFSIFGDNFSERQNTIEKIKSKFSEFDTFVFYSKELSFEKFKEEVYLFSLDKIKLLIFKDAFNLSPDIKKFFIDNFKKIPQNNYIIFELYNYPDDKDIFLEFILKNTNVLRLNKYNQNDYVEMFRKSIRKRNLPLIIYSINNLFNTTTNKNLSTHILGILISEISYAGDFLKNKKNFNYLFDLDREIKEGLLDPKLAIELAIIKIFNA